MVRLESFSGTLGAVWYSGLSLGFGVRKFGLGFESCVALNILSNSSESQFSLSQMGIITVIPILAYEDQVKMGWKVFCKL